VTEGVVAQSLADVIPESPASAAVWNPGWCSSWSPGSGVAGRRRRGAARRLCAVPVTR